MNDDLVLAGEAADMLGVSWETLNRWTKDGRIPYVQVGSGWKRYRRADIEKLLEPQIAEPREA